jgi:ATP-dependent Lon protease
LLIATRYTRKAGVRSLERVIGAVVRYKAVEWAEHHDEGGGSEKNAYRSVVEEHELEKILGMAKWDLEENERDARKGVVYGLGVMGLGEGGILPVETISVPGTGKSKLTGSLGDVSWRLLGGRRETLTESFFLDRSSRRAGNWL